MWKTPAIATPDPTAKEFREVLKEGLYELEEDGMPAPKSGRSIPPATADQLMRSSTALT